MRGALIAALLVGALLGALRWSPADALRPLLPADWQCRSWQGTLWQGRCLALQRRQSEWGAIGWTVTLRLRPTPWPVVDLQWQLPSDLHNDVVRARLLPGRTLHLQSISLQTDIAALQSLVGSPRLPLDAPLTGRLEGRLEGRLDELRLDGGELLAVRGEITVRAWTGEIDLGSYLARFDTPTSDRGRPWAQLSELDGPLLLRARLEFPPGRRMRLFGTLTPNPAFADEARSLRTVAIALRLVSPDSASEALNLNHELRW